MVRRLTQNDFLAKARKRHGDKYDYSNTVYVRASDSVVIICPKHGNFSQAAGEHLRRSGCPHCAREGRRGTTDQFIKKAKAVHGDKYDYCNVEYGNSNDVVEIICPKHGSFRQSPGSHLNGRGCYDCGLVSRANARRHTTEQFLRNAKAIHGDKYDYSNAVYLGAMDQVEIICREHGSFPQTPSSHLNGGGCPGCLGRNKSTEQFVEEAEAEHGDRYNYSKVEYKGSKIPVEINCPEHGDFPQTPNKHLMGQGCPECGAAVAAISKLKTTEEFIVESRMLHGNRYDYSKVDYNNANISVEIICPKHGSFPQTPASHLYGRGCRKCFDKQTGDRSRSTTEEFIKKAKAVHGHKYDYGEVEYLTGILAVDIICPEHGSFPQRPDSHLQGTGCPDCGLPSDRDAVYIWQLKEHPEQRGRLCYKVGITSIRLGMKRINHVAKVSGFTPVGIRIFHADNTNQTEEQLLAIGKSAKFTSFSGATECRLYTLDEYRQAISICIAAGIEIEIES